jgi:NAD(P)-dependent dehydrogenase (short-subunit alcohol dehydrogenase family)
MGLDGKVALVTGASRGIGRGIALALARQGARVAVNYSPGADTGKYEGAIEQVTAELRDIGAEALPCPADVSEKHAVDSMVGAVVKQFGRIDILVNNAGICPARNLMELTEEIWDRTFAVNLKSVFLCTQAVARHMIDNQIKGRIVSVSSISSIVGSNYQPHYCPTKAGINMFMKCAAIHLGPHGITCNCVLPGEIDTDLTWECSTLEESDALVARTPARRRGQPADIANAVAFLCHDESEFINGAMLLVDGGLIAGI